jgi:hypothetical protein
MKKVLLATLAMLVSLQTMAAEVNTPFGRSALSDIQKNAWNNYVSSEAALLGCEYHDDPRLIETPQALLNDLAKGKKMPPVMVTYRTLMNMGPNSRELISRNIKVASLECNQVYYTGSEMIGLPVIPFEEALTILHDDYFANQDPKRIRALRKTFIVASIDPRYFWAFFIADRDHMDLMGFDYDILLNVAKALYDEELTRDYTEMDYALAHDIHWALNHHNIGYFSNANQCESSNAEPSKALIVWPEITDEHIKAFYLTHKVKYKGKWKTKVQKDLAGLTMVTEKPLDNPTIPVFNVTRGLTIYSNECKG